MISSSLSSSTVRTSTTLGPVLSQQRATIVVSLAATTKRSTANSNHRILNHTILRSSLSTWTESQPMEEKEGGGYTKQDVINLLNQVSI